MKYKLSEIMEVIGGGTPKTSNPNYWNGDIPWLSVKDFGNDKKYVYKTEKYITKLGLMSSSTKLLDKGDIIISARGTVGEIAIIPYPMAFNQSCYGLRAKKEIIDESFLYYLLKHNIRILKKNTHGSVFDTITKDTFNEIEVDVPALECQKKIAFLLSDYDEKIELNDKINNNLLEQLNQLYTEFSTRSDWSEMTIGDVAVKVAMGPFCSNIKVSTFVEYGVPIISGNHLRGYFLEEPSYNYITEEHAEKLKNSIVYPKDIIFTHAGNIGQVAMIPDGCEFPYYVLSQRQFYLRCNTELVVPEYVLLFFHSKKGQHELLSYANQTGVPSIAQPATNLKKIRLPIPSLDAQKDWLSVVAPLITMYQNNYQETKRLVSLRDTLLPKLMSGGIDISNLNL